MKQIEVKIAKIESLDISNLKSVLKNILGKLGYTEITENADWLECEIKSPMSTHTHGFLIQEDKLSGNFDLRKLINEITTKRGKSSFSTYYIVSKFHISSNAREALRKAIPDVSMDYIGREKLTELIDQVFSEYWRHNDVRLLSYEKLYCENLVKESELKKLKIFNEKYQKLLDIFIEPRISYFYEDKETKTPVKKNITIDQIVREKKSILISGDPGAGKSTLLKRIGEVLINQNTTVEKKNIPVFISVVELFDAEFNVESVVQAKLAGIFEEDFRKYLSDYDIFILIDSIDEFDSDNQNKILNQLETLDKLKGFSFILGTRSGELYNQKRQLAETPNYSISRFNDNQIQQFITKFFNDSDGASRAEKLIDSLKENRIIEKLPITPLTLSLISILFEENNLEIPATITDIYDNFSSLLLGKAVVSSRVEFIDISFKERILSLYALAILRSPQHNPMTVEEFHKYFIDYFESKTLPIQKENLAAVLDYLIKNTGVLILKNNKYVTYTHDSFMEYYAAIEIFKHQRNQEIEYISNFFDVNWQNSAIFYAGKSKDMPDFLNQINQRLTAAKNISEFIVGINGAGYLLQALYQTDNKLRMETVKLALDLSVNSHEIFMKLVADDNTLFKNFKVPILWLMNVLYFNDCFNSVTLKDPLRLAFKEYYDKFNLTHQTLDGYKALKLAITLGSKRIGDTSDMQSLIFDSPILNDATLTMIAEYTFSGLQREIDKSIKKLVRSEFSKLPVNTRQLLNLPASKLRFTSSDTIKLNRKYKIVVEGKHDAEILEHAYIVLSGGELPYWNIKPANGSQGGGAHAVFKALTAAESLYHADEIIIGVFDHDENGVSNYRGLNADLFKSLKENTVKKHDSLNIYSILLPIPGNKIEYLNKEQKFCYFELEHYLPFDFLENGGYWTKTPLSTLIYSINDKLKSKISKEVRAISDPHFFTDFVHLFEEIDSLFGYRVDYIV